MRNLSQKVLTDEEYRRVVAAIDALLADPDSLARRAGLVAIMGLATGLRQNELRRLCWEHVNFSTGTVRVTRLKARGPDWTKGVPESGAVTDTMTISADVLDRLRPLRRHFGPMFVTSRGTPVGARTLLNDWRLVMARAGLERPRTHGARGMHVMRHTYATRLARKTKKPFVVRDALGHKNIATSIAYVENDPEEIRRAVTEAFRTDAFADDGSEAIAQRVAALLRKTA